MTINEYDLVRGACRKLPPPRGNYHVNDFVTNLMSTVLDYRMNRTTLANAENHYKTNHWHKIRSKNDLVEFLAKYPADKEGNIAAAYTLWGYRYGNRLRQLRQLIAYFDSIGVTDQNSLRRWATDSDFERDF